MEALLEAARFGEDEVVRGLLDALVAGHADSDLDLNGRDTRGNTALHMACANGHLEIVRMLLRHHHSSSASTSTAESNEHGKSECEVDVNAHNEHGNTALHWVATQPALTKEHLSIAELLLDAGANPNVKNDRGRTPLNEAADRAHQDLCELLVRFEGRLGEAEAQEKDDFFSSGGGTGSGGTKDGGGVVEEEEEEEGEADKPSSKDKKSGKGGRDDEEEERRIRCGNGKCRRQESEGETFNRCSRCKARYYCSRECQRADWSSHKSSCTQAS